MAFFSIFVPFFPLFFPFFGGYHRQAPLMDFAAEFVRGRALEAEISPIFRLGWSFFGDF